MPEITPLEAANLADALEKSLPPKVSYANLVGAESCYGDTYVWEDPEPYMIAEAIQFLRAIAAGEYKQAVHGRWRKVSDDFLDVGDAFFCSECDEPQEKISRFCPSCGALMDESREGNSLNGKDDSYETN